MRCFINILIGNFEFAACKREHVCAYLSDSAKSIVVLSSLTILVIKLPFAMASHYSGITKLSLKELLNQVDQNKGNRVWLCRAQTECTSNRRFC